MQVKEPVKDMEVAMPIKIAHVVRQYFPSIGGMEDVVQNIAQYHLSHGGFVPKIITLNRLFRNSDATLANEEIVDGIPIVRLPYYGSNRYPLCPQVLQELRGADVIHVHGIDFFFDYLAATKHMHRKPLVASTHGGFFHTRFLAGLKKMYFKTVTRASSHVYDRIVATSNNDGNIFSEIVEEDKLVVIENGVNVTKFCNMAAAAPIRTLIYFGRWSQNKGLSEALALFASLVARQAGWKFLIAGREYDYQAKDLLEMAAKLGIEGDVQVIPNPSEQQLAALIGQASYFLCLSKHEGFGIAPIEAMSAGLMPILSDIPPFRNLLEQSGMGLLLDPATTGDIVAALLQLHALNEMDFTSNRKRLMCFATRYDWRSIADQYGSIYENVMGKQ
jgi:alpha-1,3-mannosyltransferase